MFELIGNIFANLLSSSPKLILAAVVMSCVYFFLTQWQALKEQHRKHDIDVFDRLNNIISEQQFDYILSRLGIERLTVDESLLIDEIINWSDMVGNHFLRRPISKSFMKFIRCLHLLDAFIAKEFYPLDRGGVIALGVRPVTTPEQSAQIDLARPKLEELLRNVRECYREFRLAVKTELLR